MRKNTIKIRGYTLYDKIPASSGSINYTMYLISTIIIVLLFSFSKFRVSLGALQKDIEQKLYMVESSALTYEYKEYDKDREFYREYIIHEVTDSNTATPEEEARIDAFGKFLSEQFTERFDLNSAANPQSGLLKTMCSDNGKVILENVRIIQPMYTKTVKANPTGRPAPYSYEFITTYNVTKWIVYELSFNPDTNEYLDIPVVKHVLNTPPTYGAGHSDPLGHNNVEGATIEANVRLQLRGINNIFYSINPHGVSPIFNMDNDCHMELNDICQYYEAVDIVPISESQKDSRQQ